MSRKWRPSFKCLYVVPEICGNLKSLEIILNRILPLRIFKNQEDTLVFLGNYVDGDEDGSSVLDALISVKKEYAERVVFLKGENEDRMLRAITGTDRELQDWTSNNGGSTLTGYLKKTNLNLNPFAIKQNRLSDIIPNNHIEFLKNLEHHSIIDDYCFMHGGFDPLKPIAQNSYNGFVFDYSSHRYLGKCLKEKIEPEFLDNYIFVSNHNIFKKPFVHPNFFMLGGTGPGKLFIWDRNAMECSAVKREKSRIYKYDFNINE